ncbi:putative hydrolase [Leptothrix cholodnii SP-6]|uniref:Putative hydrolase n=2 Tax=Leptothrix cholodnii TaxID=34029 RepID=B1Y0K4_LEPCP|nr:putative hydrolase [Leptothrix cholodnii SP-6]
MTGGPVWVKLSGIANISDAAPGYDDVRAIHEVLLAARPERLLWGSDWPHTKPAGTRPQTDALLRLFQEWTPPGQHTAILSTNAARLYRLDALQ